MNNPSEDEIFNKRTALKSQNIFDRMEWAGAFGDLGTLIPFVVGYISILKIDPFGIIFTFGVTMIICGLYYKTPFPVQPMKAIGAVAITQAAQTAVITPAAVVAASLTTGLFWLLLGITGVANKIAVVIARPVVIGIILGLGMSFMLEGVKMMSTNWIIASVGLFGTVLMLSNRHIPAMFLLLLFGAICGAILKPDALLEISTTPLYFKLPDLTHVDMSWSDYMNGVVFLALPQIPLTMGNAIIAIREENNRLFPRFPVTDKKVAISTGLINITSFFFGGVPMCHGAGGMAGHVAFGARTGGSLIILGTLLVILALGFSNSVISLFNLFPKAIIGIILFLTGAQLALGTCDFSKDKAERFVTITTAAFAIWNVGIAFLVGITGIFLAKRGWLKL